MDKNTWIGFLLIALIIIGFSIIGRPSQKELAERQRINDSIAFVQQQEREAQRLSDMITAELRADSAEKAAHTLNADLQQQLEQTYGAFAVSAKGENKQTRLENEKLRLFVDSKGGRISRVELKEYKAYGDSVNPLCLFRADEAQQSFTLITSNNRILQTSNLYFEPIQPEINTLIMRLHTSEADSYLDFVYTLSADDYTVGLSIEAHNMQSVLAQNVNSLEMHWRQLIPQQERGRKFEERYARLQYMTTSGDQELLSESKHDTKREGAKVRWIGYKDQFFSTVMIAEDGFSATDFESTPQDKYSRYIKEYNTKTGVAFDVTGQKATQFHYFFVPNHYNTLKSYDKELPREAKLHLNELVPLGWKIVSWIEKILVIPMFDLFTSWGLHIGLVILLMTLVIKLIILPFVFVSYRSSAKMRVLKPQLDEINAKYPPEKMQERQQATMALYQRAGVSPMSGCLPMLFQFPVLMAMFWFFPTAIELRGKSFLWAEDLSTYDAILSWGTNIPLLGDHLSIFCLLMTITNFLYTYITMQTQATDPSMKFMKWMMYLMPLMFLFIFNDYAAGLSYYYLLSLLFTILQTMIFRFAINDKKLLAQMEANAKKKGNGQKKSGFMERLEKMQREQQRMARENAKAQAKKDAMKKCLTIALCSLLSMGLYATPSLQAGDNIPKESEKEGLSTASDSAMVRYSFGDFFDALDLPTVLGVGFTPNGIEGATFNSSMRLAWRHHKNYGVYAFISFDTHSNSYDSLCVHGTNVRTGEVWYYEIGMGVGYRIPLVKDIRAFYAQPYFHNWDFFVSIEPGVSIPYVKTVETLSSSTVEEPAYRLKDSFSAVATLRFAAGVEWFIVPNFGVFAELGYIQHLTPTVIEQAAIDQGKIKHPSGPIVASIGLSLFFK